MAFRPQRAMEVFGIWKMKMDRLARWHSQVFLVPVLTFLISFATAPGLTLANLADAFRWRSDLVSVFTTFRLESGDRLFNNTLVGRDGWLFYDGGLSFEDYQRTDPIDQPTLATLQVELDGLDSSLDAKGVTLLVLIPPNKTTIYPQYMPGEIPVIGQSSRLDQFMTYMRDHSITRTLDLRQALIAASASQQTYYRTDSHWNDLGGYVGYEEILGALASDYPALKPHPPSDYTLQVLRDGATDLPRSMGYLSIPEDDPVLEPVFPAGTTTLTANLADGSQLRLITNQRTDLPRLLIFGDSFYAALEKFLKSDFSRIVELPHQALDGAALGDWIRLEEPDIVIIECVERDLQNLLPLLQGVR